MSTAGIQVIANAQELLRTYLSIKNELDSAEVRDGPTKKTYSIGPFLKMCDYHIPTKSPRRKCMNEDFEGNSGNFPFLGTADNYVQVV
jgi:hypothetical protein